MTKMCAHYIPNKAKCNNDGIGCKLRVKGNECRKMGQLEEKGNNFRLEPVDKISPW